jgi:hypothetical protein
MQLLAMHSLPVEVCSTWGAALVLQASGSIPGA